MDDYAALVGTFDGFSYVKYTFEMADPAQSIFFQNTAQFNYHLPFLKSHFQKYSGLTADVMEELMFYPLPKELSLGAIYYSPTLEVPGISGPGVMGFTVYYKNQPDLDEIVTVAERMQAIIPFARDRLVFVFESSQHFFQNKVPLQNKGVKSTLSNKFLNQGLQTKVYNPAISYGYLRKLSFNDFQKGNYTSKDIVVLDDVPIDIGPLSGVITANPQVPHSHVILRTLNQKIPNVYIPNALNQPSIASNLDKLVRFESKIDNTFTIKGKTELGAQIQQEADAYFQSRIPNLPPLQYDTSNKKLLSWQNLSSYDGLTKSYGAKGVNFAILDNALRADGFDRNQYKGSFLIPFYFFDQHLSSTLSSDLCKRAKKDCEKEIGMGKCDAAMQMCDSVASGKLRDFFAAMTSAGEIQKMLATPSYRMSQLMFARTLIEKSPLNTAALAAITTKIAESYPEKMRIRFRSSTNAEDLVGLNGAGLYVSKAGCVADGNGEGDGASACLTDIERQRKIELKSKLESLDPVKYSDLIADLEGDLTKKRPLDKAIRKVFASLWTEKAFLNRDYYRLKHSDVYMGILVHPSFADEGANGVVIVREDEQNSGTLAINAVVQVDDISITNPEIFSAVPDQFSITRASNGTISAPQYLLRTNLKQGPVLSDVQIRSLADQLATTFKALKNIHTSEAFTGTIDVEMKVGSNGTVIIKQARPL